MAEAEENTQDVSWEDEGKQGVLDAAVDEVLSALSGYQAKFNRSQNLSVIDLKHRNEPQGTRFRQIHVKADPGFITVSIVESFQSAHGGNLQPKTLSGFTVPVQELDAYTRLASRFFGYDPKRNAEQAQMLLEDLNKTLA